VSSAALVGAAAAVAPASASGLALYEQSAKAAAQAGAWVARADDASANWYNPAALVRLGGDETRVQVGGSLLTFGSGTDLRSGDPAWGLDPGAPTLFEPESTTKLPFHLYLASSVTERLAWGVGINTPYVFASEWRQRPVTFSAIETTFESYLVNANAAWAATENWSVGGGLSYLWADLSSLSREVPVDLNGDGSPEVVGRSDLSGSGGAIGFNVAALYSTRGFSAGLSYRTPIDPELSGDLRFSGFGGLAPFFPDTPADVDLSLPGQAAVGIAWGAADVWQFEFDVAWTQGSRFRELATDVRQETPPFVVDTRRREDWEDTVAYRLGAAWRLADRHEVRFGVLQEEGAVPGDTLRPSIPDADRWGFSAGYGFAGSSWTVDAYAMPLFFSDETANGDPQEGVIDGLYRQRRLLLGATFELRF
jgi:long-chain fatty acid transport protein